MIVFPAPLDVNLGPYNHGTTVPSSWLVDRLNEGIRRLNAAVAVVGPTAAAVWRVRL